MKPLSHILKTQLNVSEQDVAEALETKDKTDGDVGEILCRKMVITEEQLLEARGIQYQLPVWDKIPLENIQRNFTQKVPIQFLKKYHMLPLEITAPSDEAPEGSSENDIEGHNTAEKIEAIAVLDPADFQPLDDLAGLLGMETFEIVLSTGDEIIAAINFAYDMSRDSAEQLVQDMEADDGMVIGEIEATADLLDDTSDAPIIKLVNHILSQSIKARASDIHIEPYQDSFKVRYRVDGILYDLLTPPKWIQASLISRIKVMAKINIAEKRLPQDGRLESKIGNMQIDVRVSTIPTAFGERVVLRLLNKTSSLLKLSDLGLSPDRLTTMEGLVSSPNGIILMTGPTGSGKTTTLYAILSSLNSPDINIITIEDPIEYQINGISQIQVNPKIDLTFARGLRSIVRQDPDVVLVGEIRDHETAEIAVQSALTGHLVF